MIAPQHIVLAYGELLFLMLVIGFAGGTFALTIDRAVCHLEERWREVWRPKLRGEDPPFEPDTSGAPVASQIVSLRDRVEDVADDEPEPLRYVVGADGVARPESWTPPLLWKANSRTVHRAGCRRGGPNCVPIKVWTADAAARWAMAERLKGCPSCRPFARQDPDLTVSVTAANLKQRVTS